MKNFMKFTVAMMAVMVLLSSAKTAEARKILKSNDYQESVKLINRTLKLGTVTKEEFHKAAVKDRKKSYYTIRGKVKIDGDLYETVNWLRMNDTVWGYDYEDGKVKNGVVEIEACPFSLWDDANYNTKHIRKCAKLQAEKWRENEQLRKELDAGLVELKQKMAAEGKELTQVDRAYYACHFIDSQEAFSDLDIASYAYKYAEAMRAAGVACVGSVVDAHDEDDGVQGGYQYACFRADNGKIGVINVYSAANDISDWGYVDDSGITWGSLSYIKMFDYQ